ncbi:MULTISPECIES: oxidoreductase [Brevibacillus]|uniref:oxidoreductase n=1 Tax=Brevibacillus TaxID=55080 RepID=UPI0003FE8145|nr:MULTISPECIES: oxidoreductase [Brevibacillus]UYZ12356.1 oxidoreductase [Brevibacillus sp. WF146]
MKQVNVGLIGYGLSGQVFHAPVIRSVPGLKLTKVVSSRPEKVRADLPEAEVVASVDELLSDDQIELVVVAAPNTSHFPYAKQALLAGKHVVVEKPFVIRSSEAEELIRLAESRGRVLSVYHNRRWDNDFLTIKHLLQTGALGEVFLYEAHYDRYRPEVTDRWRERDLPGSGILYDLGSHLIDQALHLFGLPQTVMADVGAQRPGARTTDYFHIVLGYGSLRVILHAGSLVRQPGPRFQIHGDKGSFVKYGLDPQEDALRAGLIPGGPEWGRDREETYGQLTLSVGELNVSGSVETIPGAYQTYYQQMYEAIVSATPAPVSPADAMNVIRVIEWAEQSSREQRVITVR